MQVRQFISDFAVIIAIVAMSSVDYAVGIHTPKLDVPSQFKPTWKGRGWLIPPFGGKLVLSLVMTVTLSSLISLTQVRSSF